MTVKFDEVPQINVPDNADIFVLKDSSEGSTKYVTWEDIQTNILNDSTIGNQVASIIASINTYQASGSNTSNGLKADQLWYSGSYRSSSYFLNWNNLLNAPSILANLGVNDTLDLSDLENTTGFVRVNSNGNLVFKSGSGTQETLLTTDRLGEGTQNLYYTDARVESKVEDLFPGLLTEYTSTFDQGNISNSLTDVSGTWVPPTEGFPDQSKTIEISPSFVNNFNVGQRIRVYGASPQDTLIQSGDTNFSFTAVVLGHNTEGANTATFSYRCCVFDIDTGEIAPSFGPVTATIEVPDGYNDDPTSSQFVGNFFNSDKFIELRFANSVESGRGVAIYRQDRQEPNASGYKLVYVAGPKDLAEVDGFRDYYNFDRVEWAEKDEQTNQYTSVIHFPLIAPTQARRGWADATIATKTITDTTIRLELDNFFFINNDRNCSIAHNDTEIIQDGITSNANADRKSLDLNAKTYVIEQISIPNNFGLNGTPFLTTLKKLPWSGGRFNSSTMVRSTAETNSTNITLSGIDVDGDTSNQFLFADATNVFNNYAVNLFTASDQALFDKVRIRNVVGGGLYATSSTEFRFTNGEIANSGNTDRWTYSPLVADAGENTIITSNVFRNFSEFVDVSVTNKGTVLGNLIENCGSGLFIYGSKFLLSSPNILIGPANEFLPQPDILNSVYDSVNIVVKDAYIANTDFTSDVFVYQENGEIFDLTQTDGADANGNGGISKIEFNVFYVKKDSTSGAELFWTPSGVADPTLLSVPQSREEGKFQFRILNADVIRIAEGDISVPALRQQDADHQGLAYSATYENEVRAGVIPPTTADDNILSGVRDPSSTVGTGLNKVYDVGLGLSTGTVSGDEYVVRVNNMQFLSVGSRVKFNQHTGFVANGNTTDGIGTVTYVSNVFPDGDETYVYVAIDFDNTTTFDIGNGGYINIVDRFVMAQGRII